MKTLTIASFAAVLSGLLIPGTLARANGDGHGNWQGDNDGFRTCIVSPWQLRGWVLTSEGAPEGTVGFVTGPLVAPLGAGSLALGVSDTLQRVVFSNSSVTRLRSFSR